MIDLEKRRRVMRRSMQLGHCICNPKQGCPCTIFQEENICPCAGERTEELAESVRLTTLVEKPGCASKINQNDLKRVLAGLPEVSDPRVLVGTNTCDDAGVYQLNETTALVQTVDVFAPSVDDPYTFGRIAAANSLSDVYAMGGRPLTALSIIGFPIETLSHKVMTQILLGGMDAMREAGVAVVGGHSINDQNPKFGYAVTGVIDPAKIITNSGARPGDVLILTKPLGVGIISFAAQIGRASESAISSVSASMAELNRTAAEVMVEVGVHAATDVTGFGLLGHLGEMAAQSGASAEVYANCIPTLEGAADYAAQEIIPGGVERNREFTSQRVQVAEGVSEEIVHILYDPQTSGGLMIAVAPEKAETLLRSLKDAGVVYSTIIGKIMDGQPGRILVSAASTDVHEVTKMHIGENTVEDTNCCCGSKVSDCCATASERVEGDAKRKFADFMREVNGEGAIPIRTKELLAVALSIVSKCEPCVKIHLEKARAMGISEDEIDEAVWMAVSFGGAPTMMFYNEMIKNTL